MKSFNGIRIVHHNVQGLCYKMDELVEWFHQCNGRDVIFCFSETWIKPNSPHSGFSMLFSPFHSHSSGNLLPGSCIFLLNSLQTEYPDVCKFAEESYSNLNVCCCFVTCKHQRIAVISVYHSPSTSLKAAINELSAVLLQLSTSVQHFILAGDFNINLLDGSNTQSEYMNLLSDFNLVQHVSEPTRV